MAPFFFMATSNNVFLIGLMAVGKTTIGKHLACELNMEFFDTDLVLEERAGADVAWIFDVEGEQGFRDREVQVVDELTRRSGVVLATGGGVVLREENRRHLSARGVVVFLESSIDRLVARTTRDKKRPLLRGGDIRGTFERLSEERGPLYRSIADYQFFANRGSAKAMAEKIATKLRQDKCVR